MFKRRFKPKRVKIDLKRTFAQDIEYYCPTSTLDRIICERKKINYSEELAEAMERHGKFYFIVKKNKEYGVVSGTLAETWLKEQDLGELQQSEKAKECMQHYFKSLGH